MQIRDAFELTVVVSTVIALLLFTRGAVAGARERAGARAETGASARRRAVLFHPLTHFLLVCSVIWVNQVLFGAFILRAHHGDASFIARYISGGWFAVPRHDPIVTFVSHHVGDGQWLSPTLLRVQAFLELPFTMLAYLAVARPLGRRLYAKLCEPAVLACAAVSFSMAFSLVELSLPNPYTHDDLVLRVVACLFTPVYIAWIARREERLVPAADAPAGPAGVLGLLAFLASAGAIAYVVLALYDAFLIYNLAHLPRYAAGIAMALVVALTASFAAPRVDAVVARATGHGEKEGATPAIDICVSALRAFTLVFFVPSLSLRYWGAHASAVTCGLLVILVAVVTGFVVALRRAKLGPGALVRLSAAAGIAVLAGGVAATFAMSSSTRAMLPELVLARLALSFLVTTIVAFRGLEIFVCWPEHETKAQADEA